MALSLEQLGEMRTQLDEAFKLAAKNFQTAKQWDEIRLIDEQSAAITALAESARALIDVDNGIRVQTRFNQK